MEGAIARVFEVLCGVIMLAGALLFGAVVIIAPFLIAIQGVNQQWIGTLAAYVISAGLSWLCFVTGIRLVTGRRRSDGGLFPSWLEHAAAYPAALLMTMGAFRGWILYGPEEGQRRQQVASDVLIQARQRWRNRKSSADSGRTGVSSVKQT